MLLAILILNKPSTLNQVNLYHAEQISERLGAFDPKDTKMETMEACTICNVPKSSSSKYKNYKSLGYWCGNMRSSYKAFKEGKTPHIVLCPERIQRLENIGFEWSRSRRRSHGRKKTYSQILTMLLINTTHVAVSHQKDLPYLTL